MFTYLLFYPHVISIHSVVYIHVYVYFYPYWVSTYTFNFLRNLIFYSFLVLFPLSFYFASYAYFQNNNYNNLTTLLYYHIIFSLSLNHTWKMKYSQEHCFNYLVLFLSLLIFLFPLFLFWTHDTSDLSKCFQKLSIICPLQYRRMPY